MSTELPEKGTVQKQLEDERRRNLFQRLNDATSSIGTHLVRHIRNTHVEKGQICLQDISNDDGELWLEWSFHSMSE